MMDFNPLPNPDAEISPFMPAAMREPPQSAIGPNGECEQGFDEDGEYQCWCGAKGKYSELCDASGLERGGCGGLGMLNCFCGGDLCVCHHHGEVECPGCDECEDDVNLEEMEGHSES